MFFSFRVNGFVTLHKSVDRSGTITNEFEIPRLRHFPRFHLIHFHVKKELFHFLVFARVVFFLGFNISFFFASENKPQNIYFRNEPKVLIAGKTIYDGVREKLEIIFLQEVQKMLGQIFLDPI